MASSSRLGSIVIDCHTDHIAHAAGFWSEALGYPAEVDPDGRSARLIDPGNNVAMVIRAIEEGPQVHFDFETNDMAGEIRRLEGIGARKVGVIDHAAIMEAPTGHRFRVVASAAARLRQGSSADL